MRQALLVAALAGSVVRFSAAQTVVRSDLSAGGAWLRESGISGSGAGTAGATLSAYGDRAAISAATLGACGGTGQCAAQAVAGAAIYAPLERHLRWEIALTGSDLALDGALPATSGLAAARISVGSAEAGGYVGVGGGVVRTAGAHSVSLAQFGAWWQAAEGQATAELRVINVPTRSQIDSAAIGSARTPTFTDVSAGWSRERGRVWASLSAGWRGVLSGGGGSQGAWSAASAAVWMAPRLAIVLATGRVLEDLTRGAPSARYVSVSLRVPLDGPRWLARGRALPASIPVASATALDDGRREIRITIANAASVDLMADFTDWQPVILEKLGDAWRYAGEIQSGPHRILVRIDGGAWQPPANLPVVHDEFGGTAGLITVP